MTTALDNVLGKLDGVKPAGDGQWSARCPAHEDHRQSLSVSVGEGGRVLLNCHANCPTESICGAIGFTVKDLFETNGKGKRQVEETYPYTDETGELLYEVVRYYPKDFRQRRPDGMGGWIYDIKGVRRVLYHLSRVIETAEAGGDVYVVEGEKDVHAIEAAGAVATCNPGGVGMGWREEYSAALAGAHVIIVADDDEPGRKHAAAVHAALLATAASVRVALPAQGNDPSDHLRAGKRLEDFRPLQVEEPTPEVGPFIDWATFWASDHEEAEWVYPDILARGRAHSLFASHKIGKSLLTLWIAAQLATGPEPVVAVYLDYEMTEADLFERLADMGYGPDDDLSRLRYALLPTLPPLDTREGAAALMEILAQVEAERPDHHIVVILDTYGRVVEGNENDADTTRAFYNHTGIQLKRRGITWLRLDHGGKDPTQGQRGSSAKGDDVDVVWKLERAHGGVFTLTRHLSRMGWVPEKVVLGQTEAPLAYQRLAMAEAAPPRAHEVAAKLDRLGVSPDASGDAALKSLREAGEGCRKDTVLAAQSLRKQAS